MAYNSHVTDTMVRRFEEELREKNSAAQGILANAQDNERDLNDTEKKMLGEIRARMVELRSQIEQVEQVSGESSKAFDRMMQLQDAASPAARKKATLQVEYRSAGEFALETYRAALGDRAARERLEVYYRLAAHQKTSDNLGVIPDPIVGEVINFIDAARPIVSALGPRAMPAATWHRPIVTQGTVVDVQGVAGGSSDEKAELDSQKMTITRLTANAVTYGGYVNVSRQNIDFSSPQIMDIIINDLAARYAIKTEAALAAEIEGTGTSAVTHDGTAAGVAGAVWQAVAAVWAATRGQGRVFIAVAPDQLATFGPLFAPVNPQNAQSPGFTAGSFGQGVMGSISGVPVVMSAGLQTGGAFALSTAAIEAYEQRVGTLQVTEPSVLGVQVAYAGYFTPLTIEEDAIVPIELGS